MNYTETRDFSDTYYPSLVSALSTAFPFHNTPQGRDFWLKIINEDG